jgi:peptidoglycan/xylan/chitin deacetylase (PgdA/CDA1 family)
MRRIFSSRFLPVVLFAILLFIVSLKFYPQIFRQEKAPNKQTFLPPKNYTVPRTISVNHTSTPSGGLHFVNEAQAAKNDFCLRVPVLLYHHIQPLDKATAGGYKNLTVSPEFFEQQMQYLSNNGYTTYSAFDLGQALFLGQNLPGKPIVVTIDDGYSDVYSYAYPIAKKYNIKLSLMIPTGLIGNPGFLTWENLREMTSSGLVSAYDHTWSHYPMPRGNDAKDQSEILTAKKQLEEHLGGTVNIFAYPYGSWDNRIVKLLRGDGFIAAYSTMHGFLQCRSFIMGLHRNHIGNAPLSAYGL